MKYLKMLILIMVCISLILGIVPISLGAEVPSPKQYATIQEYQKVTGKKISRFNEAPMLAELVKQGKILPVEKRLPEEPAVIEPLEEIGQYGGKMRIAFTGAGEASEVLTQGLLTAEMYRLNKPIPNIVKDFKASKDQKIFTFYLRKDLRWSDGTPFTADDILFWYEDVINNKELTPTFPLWLTFGADRKPAKFERIDDYTLRITFAGPKPDFVQRMATTNQREIFMPKHYLKQFHPKYQDAKRLETMAKEAKFDFWYQLFWNKNDWATNPDRPVMFPWKVKVPSPNTPVILERNPYYWKIDPAGNQLPYMDSIIIDIVSNAELINMKAMSGDLDFQSRHLFVANYPAFMGNRDKGNYRVLKWIRPATAEPMIALNQNTKNSKLRPLFQDRRFRIALSLAINREEINQVVYLGLGTPMQASLSKRDPYYSSEWAKAYIEYNPKEADRLLDILGLTKRDKDGFRLLPDGDPLNLTIEVAPIFADWVTVCEMVANYWSKIGIKTAIKVVQDTLYYTRARAGEPDIVAFPFDNTAAWGILVFPDHVIGTHSAVPWIPDYSRWYLSGGKSGEEPSGDIKRIYQLWDRAISTANEKERSAAIKGIIDIHKRNIYLIGTVGDDPLICIAKNNLKNVPDGVDQWPCLGFPEQFFFK
ncbi:MAG TPA: ABC transporter substrate-binding protein [bacterium]|nr:ABC transporter substrate-binding protein [bacterium]